MLRIPNIRLRLSFLDLLTVVALLRLLLYDAGQERQRELAAVSQHAQGAANLAAINHGATI